MQQQRSSELQSKWGEGAVTDRKAVERRNLNFFMAVRGVKHDLLELPHCLSASNSATHSAM